MGRKKQYYLIVDTETANSVNQPLPYDVGYAICDRSGHIYLKRSFMVAEMFLDNKDLMTSAYYNEKIPKYWDDLKAGKRVMKSILNIRKQMLADMKEYNVTKVGAYNMDFDKRALNNILRYLTKSRFRWWFPFGTEYFCIWSMACQVILSTKTYIRWALKEGLESDAGNIQTSAEACYKYITKTPTFEEKHTGLEDVEIEVEILAKCFATHKKMNKNINRQCWRQPQKVRKEMTLNGVFN